MSTDLLDKPETRQTTDPGDPKVHHRVVGETPATITEAYMTGRPLRTLCGRTVVPTKDAGKLPLCDDRKAIVIELGGVL